AGSFEAAGLSAPRGASADTRTVCARRCAENHPQVLDGGCFGTVAGPRTRRNGCEIFQPRPEGGVVSGLRYGVARAKAGTQVSEHESILRVSGRSRIRDRIAD